MHISGLIGDQKLVCGHVFHAGMHPVNPGDLLYCMHCRNVSHIKFPVRRDVDGKPLERWYWHCSCRAELRPGHWEKHIVEQRARDHHRRYPDHEIHIVDKNGVIVQVWNMPAPLFAEPLPF